MIRMLVFFKVGELDEAANFICMYVISVSMYMRFRISIVEVHMPILKGVKVHCLNGG